MGVVYEALDIERNELIALKILRNANADSLVRFKHEFRALQDVHHPNLVSLGELISEGNEWLFTMELVRGDDFIAYAVPALAPVRSTLGRIGNSVAPNSRPPAQHADPTPPTAVDEARLRSALAQLASGLVALHDAGKVHRDIKPSNVLVTDEGRLVILDFGLVTEMHGDPHGVTATDHDVVGTPAYMAPEQAASKPVGPAADWYSVGVLLYETLTQRSSVTTLRGVPFALPPRASALPPRASALPPRASALPPRASALPPRASALPPRASALPPRASALPPRASALPPRASALPPQGAQCGLCPNYTECPPNRVAARVSKTDDLLKDVPRSRREEVSGRIRESVRE